jgi:hypothetical protein
MASGGSGMAAAGTGSGMASAGSATGGGGIMGLIQSILSNGAEAQKQADLVRQQQVASLPMAPASTPSFQTGGMGASGGAMPFLQSLGMGRMSKGEDIRESLLGDLYGSNVLNRR